MVAGDISFLQTVRTVSESPTASCSVCTGFLSQGHSGRGVKLTTQIHLVAKLRMSAALPIGLLDVDRDNFIITFTKLTAPPKDKVATIALPV